ncbi:hypothetical protein H2684_05405 [Clostridium sp. cel8]|jgi:hypothetical protein|uniref:hypothetical protein n=1 Tax=Clostridium sp. cel8 TaxID=2663123 RepID=UPI0015F74B15|nr:hypothetical protein [Clostridium sp. cel8]MBA5850755.1 hypothetical protein [Clostridium sp. cel8]
MINYTLENYEDKLTRQVIHMDQAICYCPEFRATKMMHDYPSRKLQMARAVYKNELEPNEYISDLLFQSILSRQGERWQNFGESPEDCTDVMILSREMMLSKGFGKHIVDKFKSTLNKNNGHILKIQDKDINRFKRYIPVSDKSTTYLFIDDATCTYAGKSARNIGEFFSKNGVTFYPEIKATFAGWEYFAYGLVEEGKEYIKKMLDDLESKGIDTIMTLSGQTQYLFKIYIKKLGLENEIKVESILDYVDELKVDTPAYLYAGSFYSRYLRMEDKINSLVKNTREQYISNCAEFNPLIDGDKRVNEVTIWQKPVTAEYKLFGFDENILNNIVEDGICDIKKGIQNITIVFDPYEYKVISEKMGSSSVVYFAELL